MDCFWKDYFSYDDKNSLEEGMVITGLLSIAFGLWLNASILLTNLRGDPSYKNLTNFISAAWFARVVAIIARFVYLNFLQSPDYQMISCKFIAFLETFLNVYEVEWLTHVTIERYVVAKYVANGWPLNMNHYKLYTSLCVFFATLYSVLPLFGIGRYGFDLSCTSCTYDMLLPEDWLKYLVLTIFTLRSIKPVMVMFMMLCWARTMESKYLRSEENLKQISFTKNVIAIAVINIICWAPLAMVKGSVIMLQLMESPHYLIFEPFFVNGAMWMHSVSPVLTAMTLFLVDKEIRNKMLNLFPTAEVQKNPKKDT